MNPVVIVTGASSGIGKAIALELASHHASLIINSRTNHSGLEDTASQIRALGCDCLCILGDVSDYTVCQNLCETASSRFGRIDCIINNAGISHVGLFQDMTPNEWDRIMKVNFYSVLHMSHAAIPTMLHAHNGHIINISSVWGNVGASCEAVYSASKGAVNLFTKALAKELAPSGIRVNTLACGAIDTPMNAWMEPEERDSLLEEIPAGRMGTANEVAKLVWGLITSPSYLTGQIITLDGGWQ